MDDLLISFVSKASDNTRLDPAQPVAGDVQDTLPLPEDVICYCLSFLNEKELNTFALASKTCLRLASDSVLWRSLLPVCRPKLWAALDEEQQERAVCSMYRGHLNPLVCAGPFCYPQRDAFDDAMAVDGDVLATVFRGNIQLWNHRTGAKGHTLAGSLPLCCDVISCVITDGTVAVGRRGGWLEIWNQETGTLLHTLKAHEDLAGWHDGVEGCGIFGNRIVTCAKNGHIAIWDRDRGACLHREQLEVEERYPSTQLKMMGDVVCVWSKKELKFCRLSTGTAFHSVSGFIGFAESLSVQDDRLYVVMNERYVRNYSLVTGSFQSKYFGARLCETSGNLLVLGGTDYIFVYDRKTFEFLHAFDPEVKGHLQSCKVVDDCIFTSCDDDTRIKVWNVYTGSFVQALDHGKKMKRCEHSGTTVIQRMKSWSDDDSPSVYVWAPRSENHVPLHLQDPTTIDRLRATVFSSLLPAVDVAAWFIE